MTQKWDVIIIGGGLAGYTAANYLAKTNLSVLLLEKGKLGGGRAKTNKVNQQLFNLGPHALYKKGEARSILEELDINLNGASPKLGGILIENNLEYTAPFSPIDLFTTKLFNSMERLEWVTVLLKVMSTAPEKIETLTFQQWVKQVSNSKTIESLLYTLGRLATYCHAPEKVSAKLMLSHLKNAMGGTLYLDGGWQTIIDQLHNKAILSNVHVQTNTSVKQIVPMENDQFKLVLANNEEVLGRNVICTTSPQEFISMMGEKIDPSLRNFLDGITPVRGATLDVALTELPNPKNLFALGITAPLYYSVHSHYARLSDHPDHAVLHVFNYLHPNEQIDGATIKNDLEHFLDKLQPGWQKYVISRRFIPNITVNQRLPQIGDEQKLLKLKTKTPGLYFAGDWASPSYILADGAVSSGKQAAEEIMLNEKEKNNAINKRGISAI